MDIDKERNLYVQIRVNPLSILGKDAQNEPTAGVQDEEDGIYTCTSDLYPAGSIVIQL